MKKMRIMVLALMVMAMAAGLLSGPAAAHAEGSTPEIVLGAGEIAKATSTARNYTVWFGRYNDTDYGNGPIQWRVLSGGGSADPDDGTNLPVSGLGEALLISKDLLDTDCYFKQDCTSNRWADSDAQAWCTAFWNSSNWLTAAEKSAVNATTVNENNSSGPFYQGGYYNDYYSAAPLNGEHIFFLSAREADNLFTGDSDRQAQKVSVNKYWWWWLRSPLTRNGQFSSVVNDDGEVRDVNVDHNLGARPAFNLNLSSVLFSSRIQSNPYKLTLADSNRTIGIRAAITRDSATQITVPYQIDSGSNHVSLLITNKNDSWTAGSGWSTGAVKQYYATAAVSEANGTVTFTLPDNYETNKGNWQVWLLAEKVNGEHETDYASAPVAITVPAYMRKVAYVDAKGNTPANSPVACTPVTASDTEWGADGQTTWYAVTDSVTIEKRVTVKGNVNLILCDGETLTAKKGITVSGDNNSLTIWAQSDGTGILYAGTTDGTDRTCLISCAGIGGGDYAAGGEVTVNGGTVYATGGAGAAGIGGGYKGTGGKVTINGGMVNATGGSWAAGIGGGANHDGGTVTVNGGTVDATGGSWAAGIGGGANGDGGTVTVNGGTVDATGGSSAAGIGGGNYGDGGTVTINGGRVYAQGHNDSQAIGHGYKGNYNLSAGSLEIYAGAKVSAGANKSSASLVQDGTARVDACRDNKYAAIEPCTSHNYTKYKDITDTTHTPVCAYCLNEGTATPHVFVNHKCVCGKEQQKATVTTLPTARKWVSDGNAQALAEAGAASGGTMVYAVTTTTAAPDVAAYSEAIPTEKEIGQYYVWYKAQGNGNYADSDADYVTARIYFPVTFKVVGGTWTDGTTEKTMDVSRYKDEDLALVLQSTNIPQGTPDSSHTSAGTWDEDPNEYVNNRTITSAKTFTLTFPEKTLATVTTAPDAVNPTYNGSAQALVTAGAAEGGTMYYALGANETTAPTDGWSTDIPTGTKAETYYVWYKAQGDATHLDSEPKPVSAGIAPKSITGATVTLDQTQLGYTSSEQTVTVTGVTIDGLTLTANDYTVTGNTGTNATDYTVTVTGKGNYTGTASRQFTINQATLTITAESREKIYDGTPLTINSYLTTDLAGNDTIASVTVTGSQTDVGTSENVASAAKIVNENGVDVTNNYAITYANGTLTVKRKSITGATVTLNQTQLGYTSSEQTVTVTGVTIDGLTLTENDYDVTGNTGTNAADYTVTVTGKGNFQDTATAGWKIVEAGMTLSAPDVSATYDGQPHGIAVTVTEPKGAAIKFKDEAGAYTLDASPAITNAGSLVVGYQVTADNYLPVTGSATVTITPKAATVNASAQTVKEGESIQTGTDFATLTDALSGHTLSNVTLTAENGKIVPSAAKIQDAKGNDVTGNYSISYQPGALTTLGRISHTVTLKVVHGTWNDGTREDKTIILTGYEGDELRLNLTDLPGVTKPDEGYDFATGAWSPYEPPTIYHGVASGDPITQDMTFTFTYGEQTTELIMVTLKVVHGEWGDELGGREDRTIFLEGPIGEELRLQFEQIPDVNKPDEGFSALTGSWDKEPPFTLDGENYGDPITEDTVYTYTYGKIQDQPAGSETGNTETKPGAPVLGATNMDEVVKSVVEAIKNGKLTDVKDEVKQALSQPGAIVTLTLVSTPLADNEIPAQDKNALDRVMQTSGYDGYTAFDLSLLLTVKNPATGETVTEYLHASSKEVTFTLNVPDNLKKEGRTFFLLHTANGITNVVGSAQNPGPLNGRSSNFSTYAIAYKDAVVTERFTFKKVWMGSKEDKINFKVYYPDGKAYDGTVNKDKVTGKKSMEWTFDLGELPVGCYVVEEPVAGYTSRCVNVGEHAADRDRCYNGGTIINKKIPKTGDEEPLLLWAGMIALGAVGLTATLVIGKKRKVHK